MQIRKFLFGGQARPLADSGSGNLVVWPGRLQRSPAGGFVLVSVETSELHS